MQSKPEEKVATLTERLEVGALNECADMLKALAHPLRMSIIDLLDQRGKQTVTQIYEAMNVEQAIASHHLSILRNKGLLMSSREGKNTYYYIARPQISQVIACMENCQKEHS
jgi:DNA-binding transcriptional ArsR family regulator